MFLSKRKKKTEKPDITTAVGFERIYREHVAKLCRIAYNQTRDFSDAENVVHGVFSRVWEKRFELNIQGPVEHYLVRAVKLSVMDHLRQQMVRRELLSNHLADYNGASMSTEDDLNFIELNEKLSHLTDQLPHQCKKVYELSRVKGLTNKEIARVLVISEKMVEAHITKALKFLRSNLQEYQLTVVLALLFTI